MTTNNLPAAAEAFLRQHTHNSPPERKRALEALAALLATVQAEAAPRWVKTAEGLPAEGQLVLVWFLRAKEPVAAWRDGVEWFSNGRRWSNPGRITHWCLLPPGPPEGGEEP